MPYSILDPYKSLCELLNVKSNVIELIYVISDSSSSSRNATSMDEPAEKLTFSTDSSFLLLRKTQKRFQWSSQCGNKDEQMLVSAIPCYYILSFFAKPASAVLLCYYILTAPLQNLLRLSLVN